MPRVLALECPACRRKFSGDEAKNRHRVLAGDRYRCLSDQELLGKNYWRDDTGIWHRGASLRLPLSTASDSTETPSLDTPVIASTEARVLARFSDPSTSARAATSVAPRTGTYKRLLFDAIASSEDGLTFEEAARRVGMDPWQASKRVSDLKRDGLVTVIGERPGTSGKAQEVCRAVAS